MLLLLKHDMQLWHFMQEAVIPALLAEEQNRLQKYILYVCAHIERPDHDYTMLKINNQL